MFITILSVMVALLAGIGAITVMDWFMPIFNKPDAGVFSYCVIPLKKKSTNLEQTLRWGYSSILWDKWMQGAQLILLDLGLEEENKIICEAFCIKRDDILLLKPDEFLKEITCSDVCK